MQVRLEAADLDESLVRRLLDTVASHRGEVQLYLEVARPGAYRLVALAESALRVRPSRDFTEALEGLIGPNRVRFRARAGPRA